MTAPDADAAGRYDALVDAYITFAADLPTRFAAAMTQPAAPLATLATGILLVQANTASDQERARSIAQAVEPLDLNARERRYLAALNHWCDGRTDRVAAALDELLVDAPTDFFALRLQHFLLFGQGRLSEMLSGVERSIERWDDRPRRTYLDGMRAFALEELGRYQDAERYGRAASEADPGDLWSVHAVAHVYEMEGRAADGLAWFDGRDDELHAHGSFARHLWWHEAIIHLRTGDHAALIELYDREVQPGDATDALSLTNAIDCLARLEFAGVDVGDRWQPLVDGAGARLGFHANVFADAHFAYALARAGAERQLAELLDGMAAWRDRPDTANTSAASTIAAVGLETALGMAELGRGHDRAAAAHLAPTAPRRWKLGGSHAQRQVFDLAQAAAERRAA
jgi:tetratricopeptide (TPR) repeat protein